MTPDDPLFKALQDLPREIEPETDLWEGILPALTQPPLPKMPSLPDLPDLPEFPEPANNPHAPWWSGLVAAAAILAVAVGIGQVQPEVPPEAAPVTVAVAEEADWSAQMASGMAALEDALAAQRDEMDPELWLIVDQSLTEIDDAIARIEAAMAEQPDDPQLLAAKERLQEQRVALLRTAVTL